MNITTIIELENQEVENMAGGKLIFAEEQVDENIFETCVESFLDEVTEEKVPTENAMLRVFSRLKEQGIIPSGVEDFSYEMPSCGQMKKQSEAKTEIPQKVILTYFG